LLEKKLSVTKILYRRRIFTTDNSTEAIKLSEALTNKNLNQLYDKDLMSSLGERLLITEGDFWHFYTHEDVKTLLSEITE